ncbi:MAG TPA: cytochrome d ubiquinol oxidase subunit II [Aliidongia sp.]|nr:cytochrome d ubiquinol oxidase subunit II [Aliidongia sp.]
MSTFWAVQLAIALLLYVLLDGFDLGVGMLFGAAPDEPSRRHMLTSISPVWDGNETWLVVTATILWGAFPVVYATLLSAFYLPMLVMLAALILRGVAFEFRYKSARFRWLWDAGFVGGSYVASFVQGTAVGAMVQELAIKDGQYVGGPFGWASPFALLCGIGLCLGYALLGAGWLTYRTDRDVRDFAYGVLPRLLAGVLIFLTIIFLYSLDLNLRVLDRWLERPVMIIFPLVGLGAAIGLFAAVRHRRDGMPFLMAALIFLAAFLTLAVSFLPYMVPFSITIDDAAAPHASLAFMFWGAGLFVLPLTWIYTLVVYRIFKGKIDPAAQYE